MAFLKQLLNLQSKNLSLTSQNDFELSKEEAARYLEIKPDANLYEIETSFSRLCQQHKQANSQISEAEWELILAAYHRLRGWQMPAKDRALRRVNWLPLFIIGIFIIGGFYFHYREFSREISDFQLYYVGEFINPQTPYLLFNDAKKPSATNIKVTNNLEPNTTFYTLSNSKEVAITFEESVANNSLDLKTVLQEASAGKVKQAAIDYIYTRQTYQLAGLNETEINSIKPSSKAIHPKPEIAVTGTETTANLTMDLLPSAQLSVLLSGSTNCDLLILDRARVELFAKLGLLRSLDNLNITDNPSKFWQAYYCEGLVYKNNADINASTINEEPKATSLTTLEKNSQTEAKGLNQTTQMSANSFFEAEKFERHLYAWQLNVTSNKLPPALASIKTAALGKEYFVCLPLASAKGALAETILKYWLVQN